MIERNQDNALEKLNEDHIILNETIKQTETIENIYGHQLRMSYGINVIPSERLSSPFSKDRLQLADSRLSQKIKN